MSNTHETTSLKTSCASCAPGTPPRAPVRYAETLSREEIRAVQFIRLRRLLETVVTDNPFYIRKYAPLQPLADIKSIEDFSHRFPLVTKPEFVQDQQAHPPYGTNLTFPLSQYTRCHQTSGSTGASLRWPDTAESWRAMLDNWEQIFQVAGVTKTDRLFFAFSFGPFLGFWTAFESASRLGCFCFTAGSMNSEARLHNILDHECTVLLCTPTYALHLGQEARAAGIDLARSRVRLIITAGEPGGSIPAVRARISASWPGAKVFDHHGMTESGPVTFECPKNPGVLHVMETAYFAEVVDPVTGVPAPRGQSGELIITTLTRLGSPLIRYRTGDLVRIATPEVCSCGRHELALQGGILGRVDDMVIVRGVNVYPGAVDNIIRGFKDITEYRVQVGTREEMLELCVQVESAPQVKNPEFLAQRLRCAFHTALGLRIPIMLVPAGTLPRFEMKGKRWIRQTIDLPPTAKCTG